MMTSFAVTAHDVGAGRIWLAVSGEIDQDTGGEFADLIASVAGQDGVTEVIVDLEHVIFLAAAGIRALLRGRAAASAAGRVFWVVNAGGIVRRVLEIGGVLDVLGAATTAVRPARPLRPDPPAPASA
ncbi:STAS domain-containing protein [Actinoplanes sp. CA-252034]|uniref:STAS domain-containing protein n=1 Tax=Actinoplanes sp. CA-252034 TaxID=3239906 RepID=UPI003D98DFCA